MLLDNVLETTEKIELSSNVGSSIKRLFLSFVFLIQSVVLNLLKINKFIKKNIILKIKS